MIFKQVLQTGMFPSEWKKEVMLPFTKTVTNKKYFPVSLLPICGKTFEILIF